MAPDHRPHRWRRRALIVVLVVSLGANGWSLLTRDGPQIGYWRSEEGRRAYLVAYERALGRLPEPAATFDIATSYGTVRVYRFEPDAARGAGARADRLPVVLLPGWGSGAPMWGENLPGLLDERTVYALDALGDAGLSVQAVPVQTAESQAAWVDETLAGLDLDQVHLVGHSFGGWLAMQVAIRRPDRVATVSLLDPIQTFSPLRWQMYLRAIPASLPFLPRSWRERALAGIGGASGIDPDDPMTAMISAGTSHYAPNLPFPSRPTGNDLRGLTMPVLAAMAGAGSVNADPEAAASYARSVVPGIEIDVWPGATHSLPMERPDEIDTTLLAFFAAHDD